MEIEILKKQLLDLEYKYNLERKKLIIEYCKQNNPYKIGDTFTDHRGSILIERITYYTYATDKHCCVYFGLELKKDGTPRKDQSKRSAYQLNDILNKSKK
jgi:hypothetical protein